MALKYSRLSKTRQRKILRCFVEDLTATQTCNLVGVQRKTVNRWYQHLREKIFEYQESESGNWSGEIELDESYFGGRRPGKRGRGADKVPVFGVKKRDGRVYTQVIKNASAREIRPIIKRLVNKKASVVYTDKWRAYDGLVLDGYKHKRINHSKSYSNTRGTHINGIGNFWSFAKRRLSKFNGVSREKFLLHLKESEFRYNNSKSDMMRILEKMVL